MGLTDSPLVMGKSRGQGLSKTMGMTMKFGGKGANSRKLTRKPSSSMQKFNQSKTIEEGRKGSRSLSKSKNMASMQSIPSQMIYRNKA